MNKKRQTIFFVLHHPAAIEKYAYIGEKTKGKFQSILITPSHPYNNPEILEKYSKRFDIVIDLPSIKYKKNLIGGYFRVYKFIKQFKKNIKPLLEKIDNCNIVYCSSAYLPVNIIISQLKRSGKCNNIISIADDFNGKVTVDILRTINILSYALLFRLYPVYCQKDIRILYIKPLRDKILLFNSPFIKKPACYNKAKKNIPVFNVCEPIARSDSSNRNIVIIYGNTAVYDAPGYESDLAYEEYAKKLSEIFALLAMHYTDCKLIYKPHPSDNYQVMPGLDGIEFELYKGKLISQLHLDVILENVTACYSIASTSLIYSALKGIPSYTFYKLLEFKGEIVKLSFESKDAIKNPFICNITKIEDIGIIDSIKVEPVIAENQDVWDEIMN